MASVVHIVYSGLGGIANVFFSLAMANEEDEWEHKVAFYGVEPVVDAYVTQCNELGITHTYIPRTGRFDREADKQLSAWIEKQRPDAVIVHLPRTLPAALRYKKQHPHTKIIGVEHNPIDVKRRIDWFDSWRLDRHCDAVVYLSSDYLSAVRRKLGRWFSGSNASVIPNGIDIKTYSPSPTKRMDSESICLGMCSRLANTKDIETLIEAVKVLRTQYPNHAVQLKLAGTGPIQSDLEALCQNLGIEQHVEFSGFLDEPALVKWFHSLDIYTHATLAEAMSTSVMQALACGLPTIASDVPGMNELLPGDCGSLVPTKDSAQLATAIGKFIDNPALRESTARKARTYAEQKLSQQRAWNSYKKLLSESQS